jgi:hypothetical protein
MTKIVGVHGVGNHRPALTPADAAGALARIWSKPLGPDVDLAMAYYAHRLRNSIAQSAADMPEALDDEAVEMLRAWAEELEPADVAHGGFTVPARHLIERITGHPFARLPEQLFVMLVVREVQLYLGRNRRSQRLEARREVAATIRAHRPSVVIAHSLGSVVAYEALCADPSLAVDLLITLGSPLALPYVLNRLEPGPPAEGLLPRPPGVHRWLNIADPGDVCAIPRWLSTRFQVDFDREASIGTFAFHKVVKYLACLSPSDLEAAA